MTDIKERAEKGREILKSRAAQGEPGTKQPAHKAAIEEAKDTVAKLESLQEEMAVPTRGPSAGKTENHPIPAHERKAPLGPQATSSLQAAAGAIGAAKAHIETQLIADAKITGDPRWEQDQEKFEMGQRGELGFVPPSEAEAAKLPSGTPTTGAEQVAQDAPRLEKGREIVAQAKGGVEPEKNVSDTQTRVGAGKPTATGTPTPATKPTRPEPPNDGKKYQWVEAESRYILISG